MASSFDRVWPMLYEMLLIIKNHELYKSEAACKRVGIPMSATFEECFCSLLGQPFDKWSELEQTYRFVWASKPELFKALYPEARKYVVDAGVKPGNPTGSTEKQRWLDHLARDRPDLLEKVQAGELKPKTAAKQAGFVKEATALEQLKRWWAKATASQRRAFRAWCESQEGQGEVTPQG